MLTDPSSAPAVAPCTLCDGRWASWGSETYQDPLGFRYPLCAPHKTGLVEGLRRIATRRLRKALPRRTPKRNRRRRGGG